MLQVSVSVPLMASAVPWRLLQAAFQTLGKDPAVLPSANPDPRGLLAGAHVADRLAHLHRVGWERGQHYTTLVPVICNALAAPYLTK